MEMERQFKILVVGDMGVGKTSMVARYAHGMFSSEYRATIGVDFALKVLQWSDNSIVQVQLWDIAGQERFGNFTRVYYKEAVAAIVVVDATRSSTFHGAIQWKKDIDDKVFLPDGSRIPVILAVNKIDLKETLSPDRLAELDDICSQHEFVSWIATSAKTNKNISLCVSLILREIFARRSSLSCQTVEDGSFVTLGKWGQKSEAGERKSRCC